jgi:hypothetical protein
MFKSLDLLPEKIEVLVLEIIIVITVLLSFLYTYYVRVYGFPYFA